MKRTCKRFLPVLLSMILVFSFTAGAFAMEMDEELAEVDQTEEMEEVEDTKEDRQDQLDPEDGAEGKEIEDKGENLDKQDKEDTRQEEVIKGEEVEKGKDETEKKKDQVKEEDKQEEKKNQTEEEKDKGEKEEVEDDSRESSRTDNRLEYFPSLVEPAIVLPKINQSMASLAPMNSGLEDTIEVDKWAKRLKGECRAFEVNLEITGQPQQAPVDVVLVIDRSGSMNESSSSGNDYFPIVAEPANNQSYYVKVGRDYQQVSRSDNGWRYRSGGWLIPQYSYVKWDPEGDDSAAGASRSGNPVGKPFYVRGNSRLYYAKKAAINFAAKVLGPDGIPGSRVSIVSFAGPTAFGNTGHDGEAKLDQALTNNLASIQNTVNGITANGGTNTQAGYRRAKKEIEDNGNPNANKVVIMFTDGMPNASDKGKTLQSHENTTVATIHTDAAIEAAEEIFNNGVADVFSVGLFQGMRESVKNFAEQVLTAAQNKGYYDAPTAQDLDQIFDDISTQLAYAATKAEVVDKIGDNFDLIESSLPAGASYDPATREITWKPGTIVEEASLSYQVRAKADSESGLAETNEYAELTYTDIFGNDNQKKDFPVPEVDVPSLLEVSLTDASISLGESIELGTGIDSSGENYMDISGGDGDGSYTYEWRVKGESTIFSDKRNPKVSPTEDREYELTVIDSNGCRTTANMTVRVNENIGSITISKFIEDFAEMMDLQYFGIEDKSVFEDQKFEIKVTGPNDYEKTVGLKHDESITLEKLVLGQYRVEEINIDNKFKLVGIDLSQLELTKDEPNVDVKVTNKLNFHEFGIKKLDQDGKPLVGAEFELSQGDLVNIVTTGEDGIGLFKMLSPGQYTLKESKAPAGYKLDDREITITIDEDGNISTDPDLEMDQEDGRLVVVENKKATEFPKTGGPGSTIFTIMGVGLMVLAYVLRERRHE